MLCMTKYLIHRRGFLAYWLGSRANGSRVNRDIPSQYGDDVRLGCSGTRILLPVYPSWGD
jgi:hypothetical protein